MGYFEVLAGRSCYPPAILEWLFFEISEELADAGDPFDWEQFVGVTLERDW